MKSFRSYLKETYGVSLFQSEMIEEEPPQLLLEDYEKKWYLIEKAYGPFSTRDLMDMGKAGRIGGQNMITKELMKIKDSKEFVAEAQKIRDSRNVHVSEILS